MGWKCCLLLSDYTLQCSWSFPRVRRWFVSKGGATTRRMMAKAFSQSPQDLEGNSPLAKPASLLYHGLLSLCRSMQTDGPAQVKQTPSESPKTKLGGC